MKKYIFPVILLLSLSFVLVVINWFGLVGILGFFIWLVVPFLLIIAVILSILNLTKVLKEKDVDNELSIYLTVISVIFLVTFIALLSFTS
jgi:hypothetical protein